MLDKHTSLLNLLPNSLYSMEIDWNKWLALKLGK
jgi:hypothetical protein